MSSHDTQVDTQDTEQAPEQATDEERASDGPTGTPAALRAAKPPVGTGLSPVFGQLCALALIALGVMGVQEAVHRIGLAHTSWIGWLLAQASDRGATFATLVVCVLLVAAGLALLGVVVRPRPRRALTLTATTGVYLRTSDLARLAQHRVDGADGVTDIDADATRSRLTVHVTTVAPAGDDDILQRTLQDRLAPLLHALEHPPRVAVHITHQDLT